MKWTCRIPLCLFVAVAFTLGACSVDNSERVERAREHFDRGEARAAAIELKNVLRDDPANIEARVMLGVVTLEAGDPETAVKEFQKARELGAEAPQYAVPFARALLRAGHNDAVLELDPEGLINPVDKADLASLRGNAWLRNGDVAKATASFDAALAAQPQHAEALVGKARVMLGQGDTAGAEAALRGVIAAEPDLAAAHAVLGRLQMDEARYQEAQASFEAAVAAAAGPALRRERLMFLGGLVDALLAQGNPGRAQDTASLLLDIAPEHPYALFQAARADFEAGDLDAVLTRTQQILAINPDYQPARMMLAAAALTKENYALAEVHLRSLVNTTPEHSGMRKLLAQTRMNLGNPEAALAALRPLLDAGGEDARLLAMVGSASLRSGDRESGVEYLERGLAAGPGDLAVQLQGASGLIEAGEAARALKILEALPEDLQDERRELLTIRALVIDGQVERARSYAQGIVTRRPADPSAYRLLGVFHLAAQEPDAARRQFEKGLELDPDNAFLLSRLTRLDLDQGNVAAAQARFRRRLETSPNELLALTGLAQIAEQTGDLDQVAVYLEQARKTNPDAIRPVLALARFYLITGKPVLALERAKQAREIAPQNGEVLAALGHAELENGRYSEAKGTLERALQYAPALPEANFQLARAQLKLRLTDAATRTLEKTVELDPTHIGARVALARLAGARGDYKTALDAVASLTEQYPRRAEPYVLAGDIHIMRGHLTDAIAAYDKAGTMLDNAAITVKRFDARRRAGRADSHLVLEQWLQQRPADAATRVVLAQAYADNGLTEKAISEYNRVLSDDPRNVIALNNLAWLYAEAGGADNLARGIEYSRRALDLKPDHGAVADTYGWLLLQQGKVQEATRVLRGALEQAPDNPDIRYHLAVALHRSGSSQEARDLLDGLLSVERNFGSRDQARQLREQL